jgi:transcriptional regulator with XRE-family HTH domain
MGARHIPADLGARLNARRRALGVSMAGLATTTGLSRSHVSSLMSGKRSPSPSVAEKLIEALELDDSFAAELRTLPGATYRSGFETDPIHLAADR